MGHVNATLGGQIHYSKVKISMDGWFMNREFDLHLHKVMRIHEFYLNLIEILFLTYV